MGLQCYKAFTISEDLLYSNQLHQKEGKVRFFETIKEASEGLGFSERGLGKAYHAGRNRIGEYKLDTTLKKFAVSLLVFTFLPKYIGANIMGSGFPGSGISWLRN